MFSIARMGIVHRIVIRSFKYCISYIHAFQFSMGICALQGEDDFVRFDFLCVMFSRIFEAWSVRWFKRHGWRINQVFPAHLKQYVLIVAPHTSNWDFPIGVAARKLLGLNVKYVAKSELFKWPIKNTLLQLGGYPIDRSKSNSFVEQVVHLFNEIEDFAVCITPEGTRSKVTRWKTGFYHMAVQAEVPVIMVGFDYLRKLVLVSDPFQPTGHMEADFKSMQEYFKGIVPRYPEKSMY